MKKTKIIATIGPASASKEIIKALARSGMNIARLNMSHGTVEEHIQLIKLVKEVRAELDTPIGILLDTRGPEIRLQKFDGDKVRVNAGDKFTIQNEEVLGDKYRASVTYSDFYKCVQTGDIVLLCDGHVKMRVETVDGADVILTVITGGELSNSKSINLPGINLNMDYLNDMDKQDILLGIKEDIDFVAASFVSTKEDIFAIKNFIAENTGKEIDVIAKIESLKGVQNIDSIIPVCDGVMVARGDLGVEIPYEKLPQLQKEIVKKTRENGKRVIVATEMLESMVNNPRPTRAETSDVANAVYDGASAIMLSGETAAGKYPIEAVETMARIAEYTESCIHYKKRFISQDFKIKNIADSISNTAVKASLDLDCNAILVVTESGASARMVSRFRPICPIIAITPNLKTYYKLALSWGVIPLLGKTQNCAEDLFKHATTISLEKGLIDYGDRVVTVSSTSLGKIGDTNILKIEDVRK